MTESEAQLARRRARDRERRAAEPEYRERDRANCRAYYARNAEVQRQRTRAWRADNPEKAKAASDAAHEKDAAWARSLKVGKSCVDCAWECTADNYQAFDWDHRPEEVKLFAVSQWFKVPRRRQAEILAEVAKCDLRCRNCHAIITYQRRKEAK